MCSPSLARVPGECHKCLGGFKNAIATGDFAVGRRTAHRLKGMASNLGAARLARMARTIELASQSIDDASAADGHARDDAGRDAGGTPRAALLTRVETLNNSCRTGIYR